MANLTADHLIYWLGERNYVVMQKAPQSGCFAHIAQGPPKPEG